MNPFGLEEDYYYELVELLHDCEELMLEFEKDTSGEAYKGLCRNMHSLKGNCGMLDLKELENIFHTIESIFISNRESIKENIDPYLNLFDEISEYMKSADENILKMLNLNLLEINKKSLKETIAQKKDEKLVAKANKILAKETKANETKIHPSTELSETADADPLDKLIVYLLDDNLEFLEVMKLTIEEKGHEVKTFSHSDQLRDELMKGNIPDFVITDYHMDDIKGTSVVNALNTIIPLVPIATCSGYLTYDVLMTMVNSGIIGAIEKPIDYTILDQLLKRALKTKLKNQYIRETQLFLKEIQKEGSESYRFKNALKILDKLL